MKLLKKEFKLCLHPTGPLFLMLCVARSILNTLLFRMVSAKLLSILL